MSLGFTSLRRRSERLLAILSAVAVLMSMMVIFAPAALAHHADLTGSVVCAEGDPIISYTATTWTGINDGGRYNSDIGVYLDDDSGTSFNGDEIEIGFGKFLPGDGQYPVPNSSYGQTLPDYGTTQSPSGQFSGTFNASEYEGQTFYLKSRADAKWWNNQAAGSVGQSNDVIQLQIPNCSEGVTVTPVVELCVLDQGVPQGAASFNIDPATGATVQVYANSDFTGPVGGALGDGISIPLAPGTYYWQATLAAGFEIEGSASGQFTISPCSASVSVVADACELNENGVPVGLVQVAISPTSGATVVITGPGGPYNFSGFGGSLELAPGSYSWQATAAPGFAFTGSASGQFTIDPCTATVVVAAGVCDLIDGPLGPVEVTIDPHAAAIVIIYSEPERSHDVAFFADEGGTAYLAPGTYYWGAEPEDGFEVVGDTEGQFTIEPCEGSTLVVFGGCALNEAGLPVALVEVTIVPGSSASVEITGPGGPYLFTSSGSQELAPGSYSWEAIASSGFVLAGDTSGDFEIEPCDVSVLVGHGECELIDGPLGTVTVFIDADSGAQVTVYDSEMNVASAFTGVGGTNHLAPGSYTWVATPGDGFEFPEGQPTSGEFTIEPCPSAVFVSQGVCVVGDGPLGTIFAEIDPASGATVTVLDADLNPVATFTGTGGSFDLAPGTYTWSAQAADGFSLAGATSGELTIAPCGASVLISYGNCVADAPSAFGSVTVGIDPTTGASVEILNSSDQVVASFGNGGGQRALVAGDYTWNATAEPGYELSGATSGEFEVVACDDEVGGLVILPFTGVDGGILLGASILLLGLGIYLIHYAQRREEG